MKVNLKQRVDIISFVSRHFKISVGNPRYLKECILNPCKNQEECLIESQLAKLRKTIASQVGEHPEHVKFYEALDKLSRYSPNPIVDLKHFGSLPNSLTTDSDSNYAKAVLKLCDSAFPVPFWYACPDINNGKGCIKIAEGSWGEVFMVRKLDGPDTIFKVMPIAGRDPVTRDRQLQFSDVLPEVVSFVFLAKCITGSRYRCINYPDVQKVSCVRGKPPIQISSACRIYKKNNDTSHCNPEHYSSNQTFLIIEMSYCGVTLDDFNLKDAVTACSIFIQTAAAVAIAERSYEFEHRDLHAGNLLLEKCPAEIFVYVMDGRRYEVYNAKVKVTIIDFTYARMKKGKNITFLPLDDRVSVRPRCSDKFLDNRYVYSLMLDIAKRDWASFHSKTNMFWMKHIACSLIKKLERRVGSLTTDPRQKNAYFLLEIFEELCLEHDSAYDFFKHVLFPS